MKKVYLLLTLFVSLHAATIVKAGSEKDVPEAVKARAISLTRAMADKMRLDEGQYLKLKQINTRMLVEMDELKARYASDPSGLDQQSAQVQTRYQQETAAMLRPMQQLAYEQLRNNQTALNNTGK